MRVACFEFVYWVLSIRLLNDIVNQNFNYEDIVVVQAGHSLTLS